MNATSGRITRAWVDISGGIRMITALCETLVVYQHDESTGTGNKPHIHFCATHKCDVKTLKNNIKRGLQAGDKLDGNKDWKMAKWDGDTKAITYMTKGKLDPQYVLGHENGEIARLRANWVEPTINQSQKSQ